MREILFRGMRIASGEWVEGYLFDDGIVNSKSVFIGNLAITKYKGSADDEFEVGLDICEVIPETVGQYTGIADINDKKIFEGDIVIDDGSRILWVIGYDGYAFVAKDKRGRTYYSLFEHRQYDLKAHAFTPLDHHYKVIGNIHDNPELLKEGGGSDA